MRITKTMRALVSTQGAKGFLKIVEDESFALTKLLKKATNPNEIYRLQGQLWILEDLMELNGSI
jgi:hypothetical protein